MRALRGGIPRALRDHRSRDAIVYRRYTRALVERLGPLTADARPWLREAGLLVLALEHLHDEAETARHAIESGDVGRRMRDKLRVTLRQLERRAARLRAALEKTEARVAQAARPRPALDLARAIQAAAEERDR